MIARLLYREKVQGVLKYVLGKTKSTILGFGNTYSEFDTDPELFTNILYHLGQRSESKKRYVHISLNLPHGERLNNKDFLQLSKEYMEQMGYGEQPFIVVRHHDTKHQHVHIVSTTIQEDGKQINLSHDYRRNRATQKHLEQLFGLSASPSTKNQKELPVYETPQFKKDDTNGVKFYMQDILNNTLQKYNPRSFEELAELVRPYHILVRSAHNHNGRIGVSYGISIDNGYRSRFINGSTVHPFLSGPKLQKVFEKNASSKLLPMVRKRLEKQLHTTYKLFGTINLEQLPDILRFHQKLDCKLVYDKEGKAVDFAIHDKSGYVLKATEIGKDLGIASNPVLFQDGHTQIDRESAQLTLELQKCIKEVFQASYRNSKRRVLFSEHIDALLGNWVVDETMKSERFMFLARYLNTDNKTLAELLNEQFPRTRDKLLSIETVREERRLREKAELIKAVTKSPLFELNSKKGLLVELTESVGVRYDGRGIRHVDSNKYRLNLDLGKLELSDRPDFYTSPGFVKENEKVLEGLLNRNTKNDLEFGPNAFFLPLLFPNLYESMQPEYRRRFERSSLEAYHKHAQRSIEHFEKSPEDYIRFFNAKGFYFKRCGERLCIGSIYSNYPVEMPLAPKKQAYLESTDDWNKLMQDQSMILGNVKGLGRDNLKCLWASHLIENGRYTAAAYMMVLEDAKPNLPSEILKHYMENGLKEALLSVSQKQIDAKRARRLRRGIYAINRPFRNKRTKAEEVFNGFKDELTDYSKYKSRGLSM